MKEDLEQEQRIEEPIQTFAGPPGAPGETSTNFQINPTIDINTFPGGKEAFYSRPGVGYNTGGASMIGHYANFTDGDTGFLIYSENASPTSFHICKKSKKDTKWGTRYTLCHSGNLDLTPFAKKTDLDIKADMSLAKTKASKYGFDQQVSILNTKIDEKVAQYNMPKIHCSGYVSQNGGAQYSGRILETRHSGNGEYILAPREGDFPSRYMVNITTDNALKYATVSGLCKDRFIVNIGTSADRSDNGFHFLMVEY